MTPDVPEQIRGVRTAFEEWGLLIHFCSEPVPCLSFHVRPSMAAACVSVSCATSATPASSFPAFIKVDKTATYLGCCLNAPSKQHVPNSWMVDIEQAHSRVARILKVIFFKK